MTASHEQGRVTAWPHAGIHAVELWDAVVDGRTLFAQRDEPTFFASLARVVLALRRGQAVRAAGEALPAFEWDTVALVGGAVDEARARDAFDAARISLGVVSDDPFFAASHGREALAEQDAAWADAVVVDLGQTALKACGAGGRVRRPRPTPGLEQTELALSPAQAAAARTSLIEAMGDAVASASGGVQPSLLLLGVPCEVTEADGAITLGPSTYPLDGDAVALARAVLARAGYPSLASAVVNDAVLAAWALDVRAPAPDRARLVLTVGLGVGAALVARGT